MKIKKNLPLSTIEIDSKNGKISLTSPTLTITINGLKFKNHNEKFSHIEINDNEVITVKNSSINEMDESLTTFLISLTQIIYSSQQEKSHSKQKQFYKKLISNIKNYINMEG